jgi:DNA anti-recombination protein RmuC
MTNDASSNLSLPLAAPEPRRRWATVLAALLIFGAGLASGVGLTVVVAVHRLQHAIHHPEEAPSRVATMLQRRLRLSDEQKSQIEKIVTKRQAELTAIRQRFHPEVSQQLDELHKEIGEVLTEPQRERWAKMFSEFRERWLPPATPEPAHS